MMKKGLFLMLSFLSLTSCKMDLSNIDTKTIEPTSKIVTKTYKLQAFEKVKMECVGPVEIIQNETKNGIVELTAPDNYIDLYKFENKQGTLIIDFVKGNTNIRSKKVNIKVYTSDLVKIENSGAANIKMSYLDTDHLEVVNSGVGSIVIAGIADDVKLINSGVGSINTQAFKALNVKADVSGVGSISCYASERLDANVSGVGSLKYTGNPKYKNTRKTGVGSISEL